MCENASRLREWGFSLTGQAKRANAIGGMSGSGPEGPLPLSLFNGPSASAGRLTREKEGSAPEPEGQQLERPQGQLRGTVPNRHAGCARGTFQKVHGPHSRGLEIG